MSLVGKMDTGLVSRPTKKLLVTGDLRKFTGADLPEEKSFFSSGCGQSYHFRNQKGRK